MDMQVISYAVGVAVGLATLGAIVAGSVLRVTRLVQSTAHESREMVDKLASRFDGRLLRIESTVGSLSSDVRVIGERVDQYMAQARCRAPGGDFLR